MTVIEQLDSEDSDAQSDTNSEHEEEKKQKVSFNNWSMSLISQSIHPFLKW